MPPDQLAKNLQKLALLQHQVGEQLARVRNLNPGGQVTAASDPVPHAAQSACCAIWI